MWVLTCICVGTCFGHIHNIHNLGFDENIEFDYSRRILIFEFWIWKACCVDWMFFLRIYYVFGLYWKRMSTNKNFPLRSSQELPVEIESVAREFASVVSRIIDSWRQQYDLSTCTMNIVTRMSVCRRTLPTNKHWWQLFAHITQQHVTEYSSTVSVS